MQANDGVDEGGVRVDATGTSTAPRARGRTQITVEVTSDDLSDLASEGSFAGYGGIYPDEEDSDYARDSDDYYARDTDDYYDRDRDGYYAARDREGYSAYAPSMDRYYARDRGGYHGDDMDIHNVD